MRFSNHWKILLIVFPMLGNAQVTYVEATRADLGLHVAQSTMPLSTFTNCVFWLDGAAGDYNAGATNYFIPDLSTNRNDATQTGTGYQPAVVDNGYGVVFDFDGTDDYVRTGIYPENGMSVTICLYVNDATTGKIFCGARNASTTSELFYFGVSAGNWLYRYGDSRPNIAGATVGKHEVTMSSAGLWVDGAQVYTNASYTWTAIPREIVIGANNANGTIASHASCDFYTVEIY